MSQQFGLPVRGFPARMGRLAWRPLMGAVAAWLCVGAPAVVAQPVTSDGTAAIYTCVDDKGHKLTSDRPILECNGREQRILNRDGSLRQIKPPQMTADERAEREAAERRATLARNAQNDAIRRDRNLVNRYPDEATHRKAREAALDTVRAAIKATEGRLKELAAERKPLFDEAEFYKGKPLPTRLRQSIDGNDAAVDAQKNSAQNQAVELERINRLYDAELDRLRRLWAGAQPGSLGPAVPAADAPAAAASVVKPAKPSKAR